MRTSDQKKGDVNRNAIQEVLGDLEASLEAYLVEWRRRRLSQKGPEAGIDSEEEGPVASENGV